MQLEQFNGKPFDDGERIDLHVGSERLLSMDRVRAERVEALQKVAQEAYKRVQIEKVNNHDLTTMPTDPVQLATVTSRRLMENRNAELEDDGQYDFWREAA